MTTLYDATGALFSQTLGAMEGFLKRGRKHCEEAGIDLTEMLNSRIYEDMLPLRYQVQAAIGHSVGAIEGVKGGNANALLNGGPVDVTIEKTSAAESAE